jgi:hypothetical protein
MTPSRRPAHFLVLYLTLANWFAVPLARSAHAEATITAIEHLPRTQRLEAYPKAAEAHGLSSAERLALTQSFARHAKDVSPLYQNGGWTANTKAWITLLRKAHQSLPADLDIGLALARLHIDAREYSSALPVVTALKKTHTDHHEVSAFLEACTSAKDGRPLPIDEKSLLTFPLHFCVLTANNSAQRVATAEQCRKESDILNRTFRTLDGRQLARFEFKGYSSYADIKGSSSPLIRFGDSTKPFDTDTVAREFNACKDGRVRDPKTINVYIFDSHNPKAGFADLTSHGKRNSNHPYILLDWERLDNKVQNAEAHEMGHAFGLEHVGVPSAVGKTPSNIMTSASENFGSGGLRNLGFTESQTAVILFHARRTYGRLGLGK